MTPAAWITLGIGAAGLAVGKIDAGPTRAADGGDGPFAGAEAA